jgi:DNA polymerase III subunit delta
MRTVADSARYDVFQLAEAASAGDAARALRILLGLKSEGVEPTLILWALVRELRGFGRRGNAIACARAQRGGWNQASTPSAAALARLRDAAGRLLLRGEPRRPRRQGPCQGDPWTGSRASPRRSPALCNPRCFQAG